MTVENIPLFPKYDIEEISKNTFVIKSNIYLHKDEKEKVKIYYYPVISCYIAKTKMERTLITEAHLRECHRLSKYLNTDLVSSLTLPLVDILYKADKNFLEKIHFKYI